MPIANDFCNANTKPLLKRIQYKNRQIAVLFGVGRDHSFYYFLFQEVILPKTEPAPLMELGEQPPDLLRDMPSTECLSALDALGN